MSDSFLSFLPSLWKYAKNDNSTDDEPMCVSEINHYKFYQFSLIPAFLLTLLFAASKKRRQKLLSVLDGRPGLIYPMDTLTRSSRISYCCAFGATAFLVYVILLEHRFAIQYDGPIALKSLIAVLSMFVYGMVFFPVFASLALATALSYLLGSLYTWMFLVVDVYKLTECSFTVEARAILFVRAIPSLLCLGYLSISMPIRFVLACWNRRFFLSSEDETPPFESLDDIKESFQGKHVRKLLRKPEVKAKKVGAVNIIKSVFSNKVYELLYHRKRGFRYPSRLISVMFIAGCVIYVLTVELLVQVIQYIDLAETFIETQLQALGFDDEDEDYPVDPDQIPPSLQIGLLIAQVLYGSLIATAITAGLTTFINILHMLSSFRSNLLALYRGDYSNIPSPSSKSATSLCLGSLKYAGFQVAYIVWAFIISSIIIFLFCIILSFIILILLEGYTDWLVNKVLQIWPSVLVAVALMIIQKLLATFLFLQDRGQHLRLDNRRFFFIFTYFMFFYNIFLGLISCLMRIIKAMVVGTLFLARLDNSTLPRKFEFLDPGFAAYQGYIHMEAAHTHPVVLVFLRLLVSLSKSRKLDTSDCVKIDMSNNDVATNGNPESMVKLNQKDTEKCRPVNLAARSNWLVTYTLLHNPQVRLYRKGFIQAMKKARAEGIKIPISDKPITDFDLVKTQEQREQERLEEAQKLQGSDPKKSVFSSFSFGRNSSNNSSSESSEKANKKKKHFWFGKKKRSAEDDPSVEDKGSALEVLKSGEEEEEEEGEVVEEAVEEEVPGNGSGNQDTVIDIDHATGAVNI
ncbi:stimulated by retinoic acid 6 protein isoform X1 [Biomphalaria glabrata]|uniref:Stimulated by retinoic acid gene 6 protein-like n=1 Tax=Biomphalaria glabrata TaxID=6526 RepID=A0A9W2Z1P1_BIOGL|nr:stimulated by retinoic acid gene 6 protein-like [Biomphalaria glabrata]XP_055868880.1 stimulated by retinoic acid gene 6 protein-like [Biomphalaria glabrata]XP_055868881.1 stimulated by retinoic acid gene 6 protein-like [Biomphalaria glabrata]XP_055868882.1 stimulated by retinoic acid gene 6 protein-like [Biomphalaria glabrata]KAI8751307.1 putative stimulated by retinoic acid gene 6 protein isoform X1 [Biomphalaria glabrata]